LALLEKLHQNRRLRDTLQRTAGNIATWTFLLAREPNRYDLDQNLLLTYRRQSKNRRIVRLDFARILNSDQPTSIERASKFDGKVFFLAHFSHFANQATRTPQKAENP
jgi:hypothetical protein